MNPLDRIYCFNCETPQQVERYSEVCLRCAGEGTNVYLTDDGPSEEWSEEVETFGKPKILTDHPLHL